MNILAVIPARGGSKRIPRKNIKPFCGKPMMVWPIEAARACGFFSRIVVSTDDEEIAEVARQCGADTPFRRPSELSDDHATTGAVVVHALETLKADGESYDLVFCIYATSPFVRPGDLRRGHELLVRQEAPAAYTVTTFPYPIFRARRINDRGELEMIWPAYQNTRSQDLPEAYQDAGQFYGAWTDPFLEHGRFSLPGARPIILPRHLVQDIDTPEDWVRAEWMFKAMSATPER